MQNKTSQSSITIYFKSKGKDSREIEFGDVVFRKGDKVLQLVNRPNDNIFNGDIGVIVGIFWAKRKCS